MAENYSRTVANRVDGPCTTRRTGPHKPKSGREQSEAERAPPAAVDERVLRGKEDARHTDSELGFDEPAPDQFLGRGYGASDRGKLDPGRVGWWGGRVIAEQRPAERIAGDRDHGPRPWRSPARHTAPASKPPRGEAEGRVGDEPGPGPARDDSPNRRLHAGDRRSPQNRGQRARLSDRRSDGAD